MMEKLLNRPELLKKLTYSQFVKRCENTKNVPPTYNYITAMNEGLTKKDIEEENYIFTGKEPREGEKRRKLPKYFPIESINGTQWMKLRRPLALRLHKFKRRENAHEFYYSEMQLYLPFEKEEDLFPDNAEKCRKKYEKNLSYINAVKAKVMKHLAQVTEAREHVEEILTNEIGDEIDANKEQVEDDDAMEGISEHPEMFVKDPTGLLNNVETDFKTSKIYKKNRPTR